MPRLCVAHIPRRQSRLDEKVLILRHDLGDQHAGCDDAAWRLDLEVLDAARDRSTDDQPLGPILKLRQGLTNLHQLGRDLADFELGFARQPGIEFAKARFGFEYRFAGPLRLAEEFGNIALRTVVGSLRFDIGRPRLRPFSNSSRRASRS